MTDGLPKSARYEVKFASTLMRFHDLAHWIRVHPAGFFSPYPPRKVNNVYFDGYRLQAYHENVVGESSRSKVRLRWYGDGFRPESAVMEVKRRRNMLGWKLSYATGAVDLESDSWLGIRRRLRADLSSEARIWLDASPQPVLINRYSREYFVSRDGRVRVTLDAHQSVFDQRFSRKPNLRSPANLPNTIVVEFKFAPENRARGMWSIQGIPIRVSRNSKYVIGVQSLLPS